MKKLIIALSILFVLAILFGCVESSRACTNEAKICPDGSAVGRTLPNCEFAPCPDLNLEQADCNSFDYFECPSRCAVCPPCPVCSSVSCRTKDFCERMGFDANWYNRVKPK